MVHYRFSPASFHISRVTETSPFSLMSKQPPRTIMSSSPPCGGPCWLPTTNRVRFIVFFDLILALLYTVYRVATLSLVLRRVFVLENHKENSIISVPSSSSSSYGEQLSLEQITLIKYSTVFLLTGSVMGLAIEMFLFFLLNNGVTSQNHSHCKHWLIIRSLLFIISIFGSVIEHVRQEYTLIDGVLEVEKVYRLFALWTVRSFIKADSHFEFPNSVIITDTCPSGISGVVPSINLPRSQSHSQIVPD